MKTRGASLGLLPELLAGVHALSDVVGKRPTRLQRCIVESIGQGGPELLVSCSRSTSDEGTSAMAIGVLHQVTARASSSSSSSSSSSTPTGKLEPQAVVVARARTQALALLELFEALGGPMGVKSAVVVAGLITEAVLRAVDGDHSLVDRLARPAALATARPFHPYHLLDDQLCHLIVAEQLSPRLQLLVLTDLEDLVTVGYLEFLEGAVARLTAAQQPGPGGGSHLQLCGLASMSPFAWLVANTGSLFRKHPDGPVDMAGLVHRLFSSRTD